MKKAPEEFRLKTGMLPSDSSYGNNEIFVIPHYKVYDYEFDCIISDGEGWEHVSVTVHPKRKLATRTCTWQEMCFIKNLFWTEEETVVQFHPPKSEYVNCHAFCLHLWRKVGSEFELPPAIMVGPKNM